MNNEEVDLELAVSLHSTLRNEPITKKDSKFQQHLKTLRFIMPYLPTALYSVPQYYLRGPAVKSWPLQLHVLINVIKRFSKIANNETSTPYQLQSFTKLKQALPIGFILKPIKVKRSIKAVNFFKNGGMLFSKFPKEAELKNFEFDEELTREKNNGFAGPGVDCDWIFKNGLEDSKKVIIYLHGGAYVFGSKEVYRRLCSQYSEGAECRVLAVNYRLAPQNPFPCAVIDALSVYFYLLDEGFSANQIVFSGDSAGGGLALSTLLVLRDGGFSSPAGAICFSPWVDLTNSLPSFRLSGKTDYLPSQARDLKLGDRLHYYAENKELRNPYVSPLFAKSLRGLPPILIQVGSVERLRDECVLFATRASTSFLKNNSDYDIFDHTKVQFEIYEDQVHVFQIFHFLPCSVTAMNRAFDFCKSITDESSVEKLINFNSSNNLFDPAGKLVKMVTFDPTTGLYQKNGVLRSSKL